MKIGIDKSLYMKYNNKVASGQQTICGCGEIGRRKGLKIPRWRHRTGSSPVIRTKRVIL